LNVDRVYFIITVLLGCVQPRQNVAQCFLNRNDDALNTLFWWRKSCNYGSWEGHSFCSWCRKHIYL